MGKGGDTGKGEILVANKNKKDVVVNELTITTTTTKASANDASFDDRSWYIRGGMHVNRIGMGVNIFLPPVLLAATAGVTSLHPSFSPVQIFAGVWFLQVIHAWVGEGMRKVFCVVAIPCYLASLIVLPGTLSTNHVMSTVALAIGIAIWRVGICMSVCLHRYAAHAAFKCGPITQLGLNVLGCAANQGGSIWWASQHRCHHKYCDMPRDPHSAIQDGVESAFSFFAGGHGIVEEEFAPKHNDNWLLRLVDTWAFMVCSIEMIVAYYCFGREGLFVSYTSMWICQTITLWFNIANHPPDAHPGKVCQATNQRGKPSGWYPTFWFLDFLYPYFSFLVSEGDHDDHHVHFMLAKRDKYDCAYHSFILPLEMMGLVWDVKVAPPE